MGGHESVITTLYERVCTTKHLKTRDEIEE